MARYWKREEGGRISFGRGKVPQGAKTITRREYKELMDSIPEPGKPEEVMPDIPPLRKELDDIKARLTALEG